MPLRLPAIGTPGMEAPVMYFASKSKLNTLRSNVLRLQVPGSIANTGFWP